MTMQHFSSNKLKITRLLGYTLWVLNFDFFPLPRCIFKELREHLRPGVILRNIEWIFATAHTQTFPGTIKRFHGAIEEVSHL